MAAGNFTTLRHGHAPKGNPTPEYSCWARMIQRCTNPKNERYPQYGARGIKVCERWRDFQNFLDDMGLRPSPDHSIERDEVDGDYEPGNCRWATAIEQANNTTRNRFIEYMGRRQTVSQWAKELGILDKTIYERMRKGWPMEKVLTPVKPEYKAQWATRRALQSNN